MYSDMASWTINYPMDGQISYYKDNLMTWQERFINECSCINYSDVYLFQILT